MADIEYSQEGANPSTTVKINNELASDLGLSVQQIGSALRPFVAGDQISHWLAPDGQNYDVNVQLPKSGRQKVADLADLSLASSKLDANGKPDHGAAAPGGRVRAVDQPASAQAPGAGSAASPSMPASKGRPAGDVDADVQKAIKTHRPAGRRALRRRPARPQQMAETMGGAMMALGIAVIFIYLVLASQFGSFLQPIAIMVSLPLSLIGVLAALLITGSTLNIFSVIGFIMLMGLVTKNAILLVDFTNQRQREGLEPVRGA